MYDDPQFQSRREASYETVAGNATVSAKMLNFQKARLKAVHTKVTVAGTSAGAGNAAIIKVGTVAVATFTLGTNTAGSTQSIQSLNTDVPSLSDITCTNGTDATGKCIVTYEYEFTFDGTKSP
jgi:hypothetical protein